MVCFTAEDEEEKGEGAAENGENPEYPAPAFSFDEETAADGTEDGAEKGTNGPYGHGACAFLRRKNVGDGAAP